MKSCGVSLPVAASAAARSIGVAGNDDEKMASAKATEIEKDFPKLTAQEKDCLTGIDRLEVSALVSVVSLARLRDSWLFSSVKYRKKNIQKTNAIVPPASPK